MGKMCLIVCSYSQWLKEVRPAVTAESGRSHKMPKQDFTLVIHDVYTCKSIRNSPGKSRTVKKIPEFPWIWRFRHEIDNLWVIQFHNSAKSCENGGKIWILFRESQYTVKKSKASGRSDYGMAMKSFFGKLQLFIHET